MSPFSLLPRNRIILTILLFLLIALFFQLVLSYLIQQNKSRIENYLSVALGYRFAVDRLDFNFLKGLHLNSVFIFYNNDIAPVFIKDAYVSIRIPYIILGRIALNIKANEMLLLMKKDRQGYNLQIIFSDAYKKLAQAKTLFSRRFSDRVSVFIETAKIINRDAPHLESNMCILLKNIRVEQKANKVKFNSDIEFNYYLPQDIYLARFLRNKKIIQKLKFSAQVTIEEKNIFMNSIVLSEGKEQILGMGINKDFAEKNPFIDITFIPSTISLGNIAFIKDNFSSDGEAFISLRLRGLLDNTKVLVSAQLDNCNLKYNLPNGELFNIRNLSGELVYESNKIKFNHGYLKVNDLPLNMNLEASTSENNDIAFNVSLPKEYLLFQSQFLKRLDFIFSGKIKKNFMGNLSINTLYSRKGVDLDMQANLKNMVFDYYARDEKYFKADTLELINNSPAKIQKLNFYNLKGKLGLAKNKIALKEFIFSGYNGIMEGRGNLDIKERQSMLNFILRGSGFDVKPLMRDANVSSKLLSGTLGVNIAFNNLPKEYLKSICYIKDGRVDLNTFSGVLRLPSLNNVNFDMMHIYFSISRDIVKARGVKLSSRDIKLNAYWDSNKKISGVFNVKINNELLKSSPQFKKLLNLTQIKKPYIDFKFLLGGYPDAVRFRWMKGEFKENLEQALSKRIKKTIENRLDKMIEDLSNK